MPDFYNVLHYNMANENNNKKIPHYDYKINDKIDQTKAMNPN